MQTFFILSSSSSYRCPFLPWVLMYKGLTYQIYLQWTFNMALLTHSLSTALYKRC